MRLWMSGAVEDDVLSLNQGFWLRYRSMAQYDLAAVVEKFGGDLALAHRVASMTLNDVTVLAQSREPQFVLRTPHLTAVTAEQVAEGTSAAGSGESNGDSEISFAYLALVRECARSDRFLTAERFALPLELVDQLAEMRMTDLMALSRMAACQFAVRSIEMIKAVSVTVVGDEPKMISIAHRGALVASDRHERNAA